MCRACSTHGRAEKLFKVLVEKSEGKSQLEEILVDKMIILELILRKQDKKVKSGCIWLRIGTIGGLL
jgi:hypothetical protein